MPTEQEINERRVRQFMDSTENRKWIKYRWGEVYVRKATRLVDGEMVEVLDVASITVLRACQRQSKFTRWLECLERITDRPIYIENVLDEWFAAWFLKRGYTLINPSPDDLPSDPVCLILKQ